MLFSYGKTIVSELRDRENTLKMEQKARRSHQKTVREQEKEEIEKKTVFGPVLEEFWDPKYYRKVIKKNNKN